jgi:WD40 repeat protein
MKRMIVAMLMVPTGWCGSVVTQQPAANPQPKATQVARMAFSRDGRSLAVAYDGNNTLKIWDVAARRPVYSAREKAPIRSLAFSPTADVFAIAAGTSAKLLDPKLDRVVRELDGNQGRSEAFFSAPMADGWRPEAATEP